MNPFDKNMLPGGTDPDRQREQQDGGTGIGDAADAVDGVGALAEAAGGGIGEAAGAAAEGVGGVLEGVGGCLEGCSGCSLAIIVALFFAAQSAMAMFR